eukprot:4308957-Amphidinium_carterae.2
MVCTIAEPGLPLRDEEPFPAIGERCQTPLPGPGWREGQDLVIHICCPCVTHRARKVPEKVRVFGEQAAPKDMNSHVSGWAVCVSMVD